MSVKQRINRLKYILYFQQAAQEITESVVNVARTELANISSNRVDRISEQSDHYVVMQLKDQDIANGNKDLSTIIETLVSDETARMNGNILNIQLKFLKFLKKKKENNKFFTLQPVMPQTIINLVVCTPKIIQTHTFQSTLCPILQTTQYQIRILTLE